MVTLSGIKLIVPLVGSVVGSTSSLSKTNTALLASEVLVHSPSLFWTIFTICLFSPSTSSALQPTHSPYFRYMFLVRLSGTNVAPTLSKLPDKPVDTSMDTAVDQLEPFHVFNVAVFQLMLDRWIPATSFNPRFFSLDLVTGSVKNAMRSVDASSTLLHTTLGDKATSWNMWSIG